MIKIQYTWFSLLVLTLFSFSIGWFKITSDFFIFVLLVTTFLKGQLIIDYFMNLREVQLKYRILPTIWIIIVLGLIAFSYYLPIV